MFRRGIAFFLIIFLALPALASPYLLRPGDKLKITIISEEDFVTEQQINPDGTISLPRLGILEVEGKSLSQLYSLIKSGYLKYDEEVEVVFSLSPRENFWDKNWYKVITGMAVMVGIYATLSR